MNDLRDLIETDATGIEVPPADPQAVLSRGKTIRRRRQLLNVAGAACLVLVLALGTAGVVRVLDGDSPDPAQPAPSPPTPSQTISHASPVSGAIFSVGPRIWFEDGSREVSLPQELVANNLSATGAGYLIDPGLAKNRHRHQTPYLLDRSGRLTKTGLPPLGQNWSTDPTTVQVAYIRGGEGRNGGDIELVVHNLGSGTDTVRNLGEWFRRYQPTVSLFGGRVALNDGKTAIVMDWISGEATKAYSMQNGYGVTAGLNARGRVAPPRTEVRDVTDGSAIFTTPTDDGYGQITPGGDFLVTTRQRDGADNGVVTMNSYDLESGAEQTFRFPVNPVGLSFDSAFVLDQGTLTVCDLASGDCTEPTGSDLPDVPAGDVRVPGPNFVD